MPDECDTIHVDAVFEAMPRLGIPVTPLSEVLQEQPAAGVVFLLQARSGLEGVDAR
jgi:hypothetical protein